MEQLRPQTLSIQPEPTRLENEAYTARIRELNDTFRSGGRPGCEKLGRKMMTSGIRGLGLA
ncbi:hypothetical protein ABTM77_20980, partial [Acinetobacter baumannii]